ncbi:MAG TPA: hypothetical protein VFW27_32355 [Actinoplanes sp.]|nr:hypothetical protein [Actinoplanes sp.]
MNPFRQDGVGWTSVALFVVGLVIVLANALDADVWFLSALNAIPMVFGWVVLAVGGALILAGLFGGKETEDA